MNGAADNGHDEAPFVGALCGLIEYYNSRPPLGDRVTLRALLEDDLEVRDISMDWNEPMGVLDNALGGDAGSDRRVVGQIVSHVPPEILEAYGIPQKLLRLSRSAGAATRREATRALSKLPAAVLARDRVLPRVLERVRDDDVRVGEEAVKALADLPAGILAREEDFESLFKSIESDDPDIRGSASTGLAVLALTVPERETNRVLRHLIGANGDADGDVRVKAAGALARLVRVGRLDEAQSTNAMRCLAVGMTDRLLDVRTAAFSAIDSHLEPGLLNELDVVNRIVSGLKQDDCDVRRAAAEALGRFPHEGLASQQGRVVERLLAACRDPDADVRGAAAWALGRMPADVCGRPEVMDTLRKTLADIDPDTRASAANALARVPPEDRSDEEVIAALLAISGDEDRSVRVEAIRALTTLPREIPRREEIVACLIRSLHDGEWEVHREATLWLSELSDARLSRAGMSPAAITALRNGAWLICGADRQLYHDPPSGSPDRRRSPARARAIRREQIVPTLLSALRSPYELERIRASEMLERLPVTARRQPQAVEQLLASVSDDSEPVRRNATALLRAAMPVQGLQRRYHLFRTAAYPALLTLLSDYAESGDDPPLIADRFLASLQPSFIWLHDLLGARAREPVEAVLQKRGAAGLYRFLGAVSRLSSGEAAERLAHVETTDSALSIPSHGVVQFMSEAPIRIWQGRTLLAPLGGDRVLAMKLLRADQHDRGLLNELEMMDRLSSLGIACPTPLRGRDNDLVALPEAVDTPAGMDLSPCRRGVLSISSWGRLTYPYHDLSWLPYSGRRRTVEEMMGRWFRELYLLHSKGYASRTLLPFSHDITNQRRWDISVGRVGYIAPFFHGLSYPNLRMEGVADFEEMVHGSPAAAHLMAQNLLETLLYGLSLCLRAPLAADDIVASVLRALSASYCRVPPDPAFADCLELLKRAVRYGMLVDRCPCEPLRAIRPFVYHLSSESRSDGRGGNPEGQPS